MDAQGDPLALQYSLFSIASGVARERKFDMLTQPMDLNFAEEGLSAKIRSYALAMPQKDLAELQVKLAAAYLMELDRRLNAEVGRAAPGGDAGIIRAHLHDVNGKGPGSADPPPRVALVSMPWMAPAMPSIQLATLDAALRQNGIACDRHELFLDYAASIGIELYKIIGNTLPFIAEWIFSRQYFGPEMGDYLHGFRAAHPNSGMLSDGVEQEVLDVLGPVTERFLHNCLESIDWSQYRVIGFSLTISQVASSLALARLIKQRHPSVQIVFGGACCAGVMGEAILKISPYVDAVVHIEGEAIFPEIVRRVESGKSLEGLDGVSRREGAEVVANSGSTTHLYRGRHERPYLNYDPYFSRLARLGLTDRIQVWIPFEGSRGCWWGEKVQCAFCGLHEIMKFRSWGPDDVLEELDHLYDRHGISRFFAVDLILPKEFYSTLLRSLADRGRDWMIFYEVKADMSRDEAEMLAASGIRWIQPGIESLDHDLLRLIRKGTWPTHNIQLLRWCEELGIKASWNLLTGIPGSTLPMYERMVSRMPLFFHLMAPRGCGEVQLHRFSPYFDDPESYGIRNCGPHPLYRSVFPIAERDLADLVYLHEFEPLTAGPPSEAQDAVQATVDAWLTANDRRAALDFFPNDDGSAVISDTRLSAEPTHYTLTDSEAALYLYLDTARVQRNLAEEFSRFDEACFRRIGGVEEIQKLLHRWIENGLVYVDRGRVLALAVDGKRRAKHESVAAEIPYL
ncbi:RiPP maturation radical SAM C-methyltransferase [Streptomyces sp. NPDC001717]|uniref:RiPP maturation radical SAM C-methyltransferase n=1 Tax=Streptomyces sp. NPDC001717 TaxID=3364604 RepID=UPI0036912E56